MDEDTCAAKVGKAVHKEANQDCVEMVFGLLGEVKGILSSVIMNND